MAKMKSCSYYSPVPTLIIIPAPCLIHRFYLKYEVDEQKRIENHHIKDESVLTSSGESCHWMSTAHYV